jgi:hypothetical protein
VEVYRVHQIGSFIFKSTPKVGTTLVSLEGHKHAYTDLTGSSTTADQAIVSNGTANGWTLKTLGSRAFDSNTYIQELDYYSHGSAENKAYRNYSGTSTEDYLKNLSMFAYDKARNEIIGGRAHPNGLGIYLMRTYSDTGSTAGVPKYSGGLYLSSSGCEAVLFGYSNNNWFCNTIYHTGNIPSNSKDKAGIVPKGVASRVYMTDSTGAPSWT